MEAGEVARSVSDRGEMILRRRSDEALELRVNGVFVMDTAQTSAERQLASLALAAWRRGWRKRGRLHGRLSARVIVGGLGLGFTLHEVLRDASVTDVVVAEIEPDLVAWHRGHLVPQTSGWLADQRVRIIPTDVAAVVHARAAESVDVLLLDVDNGPGGLVYEANAALYRSDFLATCRRVMSSAGVTAIWSAEPSSALSTALSGAFERVEEVAVPVRLGQREAAYTLLLASTAGVEQPEAEGFASDTVAP